MSEHSSSRNSNTFTMERWDVETVLRVVGETMARQDKHYGGFGSMPPQALLGLACIRTELREAEDAWQERHKMAMFHDPVNPPDWHRLRSEVLDVAAVACRLLRDLEVPVVD